MDGNAQLVGEYAGSGKEVKRILGLVGRTEHWYRENKLDEDIQNLSYYRGKFWGGDGVRIHNSETYKYAAEQNETFPIVDTIVSALAMSTPAVECMDRRFWSTEVPDRDRDLTISGRRLASVLNFWLDEDEMDTLNQELVLHAELFGIGVAKTSWSTALQRPIWRTRLPWEWHCDPGAKRPKDMTWAFERFVLHIDDVMDAINEGKYRPITKAIRADTYPRSLIAEKIPYQEEVKLKESGLREFVGLIEFWDLRKGLLYHIHPDTQQILLKCEVPYGNPYTCLVFHDAVGRVRGLSDVSMIASSQRDVNELVSARREVVRRLPHRMLMDRGLWRDESEFERWKNSKSWEPTLVDFPAAGDIQAKVWVSPEMPTTYDFRLHKDETVTSIRWTVGLADYQRGEAVNIRTAAEAHMVRASVEGRIKIRTTKMVRCVTNNVDLGMRAWKWAAANPNASRIDMHYIASTTQGDADASVLINDLRKHTPKFRILPFSPLMEDKYTRRQQITELVNVITEGSPLGMAFNQYELAREIAELYGLRPSIVKSKEEIERLEAAAMAQQQGAPAPGIPGPVAPTGLPGPVAGGAPPIIPGMEGVAPR